MRPTIKAPFTVEQMKAARGLLGWTQIDLADRTLETVGEINQLATSLYETNQDIFNSSSRLHAPADLLDRRDELLRQMSELVTIQAVEMPSAE